MQILKKHKPLILLWITLTSTAPFIFYSWPGHPYKTLTFACLLMMSVQIAKNWNLKIFDIKILVIILLQITYYLFDTFYHDDVSNINLCIQLISLFIIISFINGFIGFRLFVKSYIYIILAMGIGGTIIFFLHALIGIQPLFSVNYSATGTSYLLWLTTTNVYFDVANIRIIRYSGFFDEPGTFALFSLFAILLNRVYFKNSRIEIWLILVTMFTLSLAFYFGIFIFFLLFYINKSNLKYLIIALIVIGFSYNFIKSNTGNETIGKLYELTFKRFELDETGIKGNSRMAATTHDKYIFYKYPTLGAGSATKEVQGSNLFSIFAQYGILGSLFYYALLIYLFIIIIKKGKKQRSFFLKILFLILINFYSRPEFSSVFTLLIFISIIYYIRNDMSLDESTQQNEVSNIKLN